MIQLLTSTLNSVFIKKCTFYITCVGIVFLASIILILAWISTGLQPLNYYVRLVHLMQFSNRRVIQVFSVNNYENENTSLLERFIYFLRRLTNLQFLNRNFTSVQENESYNVTELNSNSFLTNNENINEEENFVDQTTVLIIQTPYSVTRFSGDNHTRNQTFNPQNNVNFLNQSLNQSLNVDLTTNLSEQLYVPSNLHLTSEQNYINLIYRVLRNNTDNEIATAAAIALYSRHVFNSNNNNSNTSVNINLNNSELRISNLNVVNRTVVERLENTQRQLLVSRVSNVESNGQTQTNLNNLQNVLSSINNIQMTQTQETLQSNNRQTIENSSFSNSIESTTSLLLNSDLSILPENLSNTTKITTNNSKKTSNCLQNSEKCKNDKDKENKKLNQETTEKTSEINLQNTTIRLKFLDDSQRLVKTWLHTSVGDFKRQCFADLLNNGKVVRLIFQGQLLRDNTRTLASYGIHDDCAIHCHVGTRPYHQIHQRLENNLDTQNDVLQNSFDRTYERTNQNSSLISRFQFWSERMIHIGSSWFEIIFLTIWDCLIILWNWSQNVDENNNQTNNINNQANVTYWRMFIEKLKYFVRVLLGILFDASFFSRQRNRNQRNLSDDDNHLFNTSTIFGLLFAMKFGFLWLVAIYYPQFTDFKGIFFLIVLTTVTAIYFFFNGTVNRF